MYIRWKSANTKANSIEEARKLEYNTEDYLKKALLEAQERVRDYMLYSDKIEDEELSAFFADYAENEGHQARKLQEYLKDLQ